MFSRLLLAITFSLLSSVATAAFDTGDAKVDSAIEVLMGRDFAPKRAALEDIANSSLAQRYQLLEWVLTGELRVLKKGKRLARVKKEGKKFVAVGAIGAEPLGTHSRRKFKKLAINNELRRTLGILLSPRDLNSEDSERRLAAVQTMSSNPSPALVAVIETKIQSEPDPRVKAAMELLIALAQLKSDDASVRLASVEAMKDTLSNGARGMLMAVAESDPDDAVKRAAFNAVRAMDGRIQWYRFAETLFFGISLGSVLALAAFGLAITFGVMGVINMAHGEFIMLGAYTAYFMQLLLPNFTATALLLAIPMAFLVSGAAGVLLERSVIRFLYGRPLETLLATFGISLILQQAVRTLVSSQNVPVSNPGFMSGFIAVNDFLSLTYNRLFIVLFTILVFVGLYLIMKRTRLGLEVRAVSQNRSMAVAMGIKADRVDALTFGLGAGVAGIAGVALSQLTNVGPNLGQSYIVDSFLVVVFGGVGNLWGTLVGAMGLGLANKVMEPWAGAVMAKILVLVLVIMFIQKRPRGLFPQKGRAAEG